MNSQTIIIAFLLTLFAGLSTGIGSLIALIAKRTNTNFLSFALGLSAGVMIYVSFMEMLPNSLDLLTQESEQKRNTLYNFRIIWRYCVYRAYRLFSSRIGKPARNTRRGRNAQSQATETYRNNYRYNHSNPQFPRRNRHIHVGA